jgi:hypothetical protein
MHGGLAGELTRFARQEALARRGWRLEVTDWLGVRRLISHSFGGAGALPAAATAELLTRRVAR